jgi:hypothetical protein
MSDVTAQKQPGDGEIPWEGRNKHYVLEGRFDFSATNVGSAETTALFDVKADHVVMGMSVKVVTAEGGTATVDIGITGDDVDRFIDGADINAAADTFYKSGDASTKEVVIAEGGHHFITAGVIDLLANNALDAAVIDVKAYMIDLS